jgi:hypothetical protein
MSGTERPTEAGVPRQKRGKGRVLSYTALAWAVVLSACSTTKELVVLLPGEDGQVGAVAIAAPQRTTILDTPLEAAKIDAKGHVTQGTLSEEDVKRTFAEALAAQPPKALSFLLYFVAKALVPFHVD